MISIIIPIYNEEGFIEKTLNCLSELRIESDFEVIAPGSNSTGRTTETAGNYAKVICADKEGCVKTILKWILIKKFYLMGVLVS